MTKESSPGLGLFVYADELALDVPQRGDASTPGIHLCAVRVCSHQAHRAQDELDKALLSSGLSPGNWRAELGPAHAMYPDCLLEDTLELSTSRKRLRSFRPDTAVREPLGAGPMTCLSSWCDA
jgi:hypothetical protein